MKQRSRVRPSSSENIETGDAILSLQAALPHDSPASATVRFGLTGDPIDSAGEPPIAEFDAIDPLPGDMDCLCADFEGDESEWTADCFSFNRGDAEFPT